MIAKGAGPCRAGTCGTDMGLGCPYTGSQPVLLTSSITA